MGEHGGETAEDEAQQQQPRLRLLALGAVPGRETRRTLLGLDEIGILALRPGAEDAGERAKRAADHSTSPAAASTSSVGSGGKATMAASPKLSG